MSKGKERIIYIYSPSSVVTGGSELLHQLCNSLNNRGYNAFMVYYPDNSADIPVPYIHYNVSCSKSVTDESQNVLILPEAFIDLGFKFKKLKKVHWWLSVDNFFILSILFISPIIYLKLWRKLFIKSIGAKIKYFFHTRKTGRVALLSYNYIKDPNILNLVQSKYAYEFLKEKKFKNISYLSDYINNSFNIGDDTVRNNVILYNPKKGIEFTKTLIAKFSQFKWIPIENMTYDQVNDLMTKSKLYVDFGNHPGKDRMPREAVLSGMCIITGIQGSAAYFDDVSILSKYKFDESKFDESRFEITINSIFENFEQEYTNFLEYKKLIQNSEHIFDNEVDEFVKTLNQC